MTRDKHKRTEQQMRGLEDKIHAKSQTVATFEWEDLDDPVQIGEGEQAIVWRATCAKVCGKVDSPKSYAIKCMRPHLLNDEREKLFFLREARLLNYISHECIIQGVALGVSSTRAPAVMLELVASDAFKALRLGEVSRSYDAKRAVRARWPDMARLRMAHQISSALEYLHSEAIAGCCVMHRDLKPDNVGLTVDGQVRLLDFGFSVVLDSTRKEASVYRLTGSTGSRRYMAPEVVLSQPYGAPADCYSAAIMMWEILALNGRPYAGMGVEEHGRHVVRDQVRPAIPSTWDKALLRLFARAWTHEASERTVASLLHEELLAVAVRYTNAKSPLTARSLVNRAIRSVTRRKSTA